MDHGRTCMDLAQAAQGRVTHKAAANRAPSSWIRPCLLAQLSGRALRAQYNEWKAQSCSLVVRSGHGAINGRHSHANLRPPF